MESEKKYLPQTKKFFEQFVEIGSSFKNLNKGNDKMMHSALWYEKFRRAMEDQEDHLILKNAISRIVRRKYALAFSVTPESLFDDLMNELAWADYINLDSLTDEEISKIKTIIDRYLVLLANVKSRIIQKYDAQKIIIGWMASEIDEVLFCRKSQQLLIDYTYLCLKDNIKAVNGVLNEKEVEIQLKLSILTLLYKPDYSYAQFWLVNKLFPDFNNFDSIKAKEIGFHFDNIVGHTEKVFKNPYAKNYLSYIKRHIAPFILIKELPNYEKDLSQVLASPEVLKKKLIALYDVLIKKTREKVWRGTIRALIFILITKISLAFLIELPYDQFLKGSINYLSLMINVLFPPILMFFAGASVQNPPGKNRDIVLQAIDNLIVFEKIDSKPFYIGKRKKSASEVFFNFLYILFNIGIIIGVIYLLRRINFNFVSIGLFFTFISAVSFFSFRIRNIAHELVMQVLRENLLVSVIEFVFVPFILIGKFLSAVITKQNPFTITLDFLIEAPLKTIIKISNSWFRFIKQKKDDIDM